MPPTARSPRWPVPQPSPQPRRVFRGRACSGWWPRSLKGSPGSTSSRKSAEPAAGTLAQAWLARWQDQQRWLAIYATWVPWLLVFQI
ncbi:MAG: hypothetical protein FJY55_13090 [Betaproteobacteria bacterium]|nr:hypothetical protein [Betaproteobacteria bacterium]